MMLLIDTLAVLAVIAILWPGLKKGHKWRAFTVVLVIPAFMFAYIPGDWLDGKLGATKRWCPVQAHIKHPVALSFEGHPYTKQEKIMRDTANLCKLTPSRPPTARFVFCTVR